MMLSQTMNAGAERAERRRVRAAALQAAFVFITPAVATAQARTLSFYDTHTHEHLTVTYRFGREYVQAALDRIHHLFRDPFTGGEHPIDPLLLDFLYDLLQKVGYHREVHVISGYRSLQTNNLLRNLDRGVAKGSLHLQGRALDFRLPGIDTRELWETAQAMKRGGTGYYRESDFIQIDTGPVRSW